MVSPVDGTGQPPLLLDKFNEASAEIIEEWICLNELPGDSNADPEAIEDSREEKTGASEHFYELYDAFSNPDDIGLGKMPDDLEDVLVDMVLSSPAVCAFSRIRRFF